MVQPQLHISFTNHNLFLVYSQYQFWYIGPFLADTVHVHQSPYRAGVLNFAKTDMSKCATNFGSLLQLPANSVHNNYYVLLVMYYNYTLHSTLHSHEYY